MLAGAWEEAEKVFRRGYRLLVGMKATGYASTVAGQLGEALCRLGRFDEAEDSATICRNTATEDDFVSQTLWRRVHAEVLSANQRHEEAIDVATEAVELTQTTDWLIERADTLMTLGVVLEAARHVSEAARAVGDAVILYERKGDTVSTERAKELLERFSDEDNDHRGPNLG
jgi:tetratricopeptide (TPR) repeat protein